MPTLLLAEKCMESSVKVIHFVSSVIFLLRFRRTYTKLNQTVSMK